MNAEVKQKWLEALRSGEYKQTDGGLHDVGANLYCCLGVLCEVACKDGVNMQRQVSPANPRWEHFDGEGGFLPKVVKKYSDLTQDEQHIIAQRNDDGDSFETIADYIEENL